MPSLGSVTFDCADAGQQAAFWAAALGWTVLEGASTDAAFVGGAGKPDEAPMLLFFRVDEPKVAKNRNHIDLHTSDLDGEFTRLLALGAQVIHEKREWNTHWYTLADPEGNEFCVVDDADAPA